MVRWWIGLNSILIVIILKWSWQKEYISAAVSISKIFSQLSVVLVLMNLNLYFVFLIIRKTNVRKVKVKLAKFSRKAMKLHIPIAVSAVAFIIIHAILMMMNHPHYLTSAKFVSGYVAIFLFIMLLITGYLRHLKSTGLRRRSHFITAFTFFTFVLIHIFM